MGCSSCGRKYRALGSKGVAAPSPAPVISSVPRRLGIIRRSQMDKKPDITKSTFKPTKVPPPPLGPIDPSTGIPESVIKTGTENNPEAKLEPFKAEKVVETPAQPPLIE